jgi:ABC-type transport system involved in multi-copper enzyme maturation permease subunit
MEMSRTAAVAWGVVLDALHRKVFYAVLAFTAILILLVPMLPTAEVGVQLDLAREAALGLTSIMAFVLAVILGATIIPGEAGRRSIYNTLSRPLRRRQYYVGKYLGVLVVLAASLAFTYLVVLAFVGARYRVLNPGLAKAFFAVFLEGAVLASVAMLVSVYITPVPGVLLTGLFYVVSHVKGDFLHNAMSNAENSPVLRGLAGIFYYALPNLERMNINETVAHGERIFKVGAVELALIFGLAVSFIVIFTALGVLLFERKDL